MVVVSAGVTTRVGQLILSRQFVDVERTVVEGLYARLERLLAERSSGVGGEPLFIDLEAVRFYYKPLENLHVVIIVDKKLSNVVKDLETLNLLQSCVTAKCPQADVASVKNNAFDIVFAFDEVVGYFGVTYASTLSDVERRLSMWSGAEMVKTMTMKQKEEEARQRILQKMKEFRRARKLGMVQPDAVGSDSVGGTAGATGGAAAAASSASGRPGGPAAEAHHGMSGSQSPVTGTPSLDGFAGAGPATGTTTTTTGAGRRAPAQPSLAAMPGMNLAQKHVTDRPGAGGTQSLADQLGSMMGNVSLGGLGGAPPGAQPGAGSQTPQTSEGGGVSGSVSPGATPAGAAKTPLTFKIVERLRVESVLSGIQSVSLKGSLAVDNQVGTTVTCAVVRAPHAVGYKFNSQNMTVADTLNAEGQTALSLGDGRSKLLAWSGALPPEAAPVHVRLWCEEDKVEVKLVVSAALLRNVSVAIPVQEGVTVQGIECAVGTVTMSGNTVNVDIPEVDGVSGGQAVVVVSINMHDPQKDEDDDIADSTILPLTVEFTDCRAQSVQLANIVANGGAYDDVTVLYAGITGRCTLKDA